MAARSRSGAMTEPKSKGVVPRNPRQQGPCLWLAIFAALTSLMLFLDILFGLRLPRSLIYWFNPIAWLGNWTQLTAVTGGFLRGIDLAVTSIASLLGIPVIGSFLYWFVFGWLRWRRPGLVFFLLTVPCLCAMQFTTKRAYEALAERYHAQSRTQLEASAISKALYVIQASHTSDPGASRLAARLAEIQSRAQTTKP